jgi:hypothetical protein
MSVSDKYVISALGVINVPVVGLTSTSTRSPSESINSKLMSSRELEGLVYIDICSRTPDISDGNLGSGSSLLQLDIANTPNRTENVDDSFIRFFI